jgi:hypothetical protein
MRLAAFLATAVLIATAAGCGDDDDDAADEGSTATTATSAAQTCVDSWNAEGNEAYQTAAAGIISATGAAPDEFRVGTWPEAEQTTRAWNAEDTFGANRGNSREITVAADSCVVVVPPSTEGTFVFVESEGGWHFVQNELSKFPSAADRALADADDAAADALGKLELN